MTESKISANEGLSSILSRSYANLIIWERIVSLYPLEEELLPSMRITNKDFRQPQNINNPTMREIVETMKNVTPIGECATFSKKEYKIEDLLDANDFQCHFDIMTQLRIPNSSAFEVDLQGDFLHQIQNLNKYILTSQSTNDPHLKTLKHSSGKLIPNQLSISFYTTEEIAEKLLQSIVKEHKDYDYEFIFPSKNLKVFNYYTIPPTKIENKQTVNISADQIKPRYSAEFISIKNPNIPYGDNPGYYGKEEQKLLGKLSYCTIEDENNDRRDLYVVLYDFFQQTIKNPLYDQKIADDLLIKDRQLERKIRLMTNSSGVILQTNDKKEVSLPRGFARKSPLLKRILDSKEANEDTSGWSDEELQETPLLEVVIPVDVNYNDTIIIKRFLCRELSSVRSVATPEEFVKDFVKELGYISTAFLSTARYFELNELVDKL